MCVRPLRSLQVAEQALTAFLKRGCPHAAALLPRCLAAAVSAGAPLALPSGGELSALAWRDKVVTAALAAPWPRSSAVALAATLRDAPLTLKLSDALCSKVLRSMRSAQLADLPALTHHLLAAASGGGDKRAALAGLAQHFAWRERCAARDAPHADAAHTAAAAVLARRVEATCALTVHFAAKRDAEPGAAWLRDLGRGPGEGGSVTPFAAALALSLASLPQLEQHALKALRLRLTAEARAAARASRSAWAAKLPAAPPSAGDGAGSLAAALLAAVARAGAGWDALLQPAVALGAALLACGAADGGAAAVSALAAAAAAEAVGPGGDPLAAAAAACPGAPNAALGALGASLLLACFGAAECARGAVLDACAAALAAPRPDGAALQLRTLALLCRRHAAALPPHAPRLKESLEYAALLAPAAATGLLLALRPLLFGAGGGLRDHAVLVLRKAMFARDEPQRLAAARGFLFLILQERGAGARARALAAARPDLASGSQSSRALSLATAAGGDLLAEMEGFLRRCLAQQAPVRAALYRGLAGLAGADAGAAEAAAALLLPQLRRYVAEDGTVPGATAGGADPDEAPFDLGACVAAGDGDAGMPRPVEPFHALLRAAASLPQAQAPPPLFDGGSMPQASPAPVAELGAEVRALRRALAATPLSAFDLAGPTAAFAPSSPGGRRTRALAAMLCGVFEVAVEAELHDVARGQAAPDAAAARITHAVSQCATLRTLGKGGMAADRAQRAKAAKLRGKGAAAAAGASPAASPAQPTRPRGRGAGASGAAGADGSSNAPDYDELEAAPPMLSPRCVGAMLDAIVNDALQTPKGAPKAATSEGTGAAKELVRSGDFQTFALGCAARALAAARSPAGRELAWLRALAAGDDADVAAVDAVAGGGGGSGGAGEWRSLAPPLLRCADAIVKSAARMPGSEAASSSKHDSPSLTALRCLDALLALCTPQEAAQALRRAFSADSLLGGSDDEDDDSDSDSESDGAAARARRDAARAARRASAAARQAAAGDAALGTGAARLTALATRLLRHGCFWREADAALAVVARCAALLPRGGSAAAHVASWAHTALRSGDLPHSPAAKQLAALAVGLTLPPDDLVAAVALSEALKEAHDAGGDAAEWRALNAAAAASGAAMALLAHADAAADDVDWLLAELKAAPRGTGDALAAAAAAAEAADDAGRGAAAAADEAAAGDVDDEDDEAGAAAAARLAARRRVAQEDAAHERLCQLATLIAALLGANLPPGAAAEAVIRTSTRLFRAAAAAAALALAPRGARQAPPSRKLRALADALHRDLLTPLYDFLKTAESLTVKKVAAGAAKKKRKAPGSDDEESDDEKPAADAEEKADEHDATGAASAAALRRAEKGVPGLIFQIEAFEKHLSALETVTKAGLLRHARHAQVRDFKLKPQDGKENKGRAKRD